MPVTRIITQRVILTLTSNGKVQFIRDQNLRGFGIKVTANGKMSYFVEARVRGGRSVRKNIGDVDLLDLNTARLKAREALLELKSGVDIGRIATTSSPLPTVTTLQDALDQHLLIKINLKDSTRRDYRKVVSNCFSSLLATNIENITKTDVADAFARITKKSSQTYAKKGLRTLKAILNSSGVVRNPVTEFMKMSGLSGAIPSKTSYLSAHEIASIIDFGRRDSEANPYKNKDDDFSDLIMFYLLTGCRKNEALRLKASDHNFPDGTLTFRDTKSGRDHTIPCTGFIEQIINRQLPSSVNARIFPYSESSYRTKLNKMRNSLGFKKHWTTHDLRRTFSEHCQLIGVDIHLIASCLNHAPAGVTARSYLGGGLAKKAMLTDVYEKLQRQYSAYALGLPEEKYPSDINLSKLASERGAEV